MAKDLNRSIKIYIDQSDAMKKADSLKEKIGKLQSELQDLAATGKKDTAEYAKKEKALQQLQGAYQRYIDKVIETEHVLKNLSGATQKQLETVRNQLRKELKETARGTDEYKAKLQALIAVEKELAKVSGEMKSEIGSKASMWSRAADGFNKYFGLVTSFIAAITGVSFTLRKLAEDNAKMDDVYSDVMKTTGMVRDQVVDLNVEFKNMDTRTAREELNNLARDAGKLGRSGKKDIMDFVEAGNQINVSLGEDLGEGAIKSIGKLTDVFLLSTKEMDRMDLKGRMLAIGSAINELGASSTASEGYMVNFTQRLGGVAAQAGISIQNILGYASALDQSGQAVEMSATALQKFIMTLMGEPAKFAKIAGLEVKAFNKLIKEDTNAAIKEVLSALSQKGGFQQLIPIFKEMGLDGARAVGVLSALATNIDKVNVAQEISNKAFSDGTSITDEYNVKNNNLQATLEKQRKAFNDAALELGERLNPVLLKSTNLTTYFIKLLPSVLDFFEKYGKGLLIVIGLTTSYIASVKLSVYWETVKNVALAISKMRLAEKALAQAIETGNTTRAAVAERLYAASMAQSSIGARAYITVVSLLSAAKYLLMGNITKARQAMQAFTLSLSLNPMALGITAVMGLVAAFGYLYMKVQDTTTAQKAIKEATKDLNAELAKEQSHANNLFEALKRVNPESEDSKKIKDEIIKLYGPYLQGLIDEKGNLTDIAQAQALVNTKIRESIALKIKNAATDKIQGASIEDQVSAMDNLMSSIEKQLSKNANYNKGISNAIRENINKTISEAVANGKTGMIELTQAVEAVVKKEGIKFRENSGLQTSIPMDIATIVSGVYNTQKEIKKVEDQFSGMISQATEINNLVGGTSLGGSGGAEDYTPSLTEKEQKEALQKQKEDLSLMLENLETKHQEKLFTIKKQYSEGFIKSDSEFNTKTFAQEQAYYLLREQALITFSKKVTDKELKSDINKQIADLQNKRIDQEIKFQAKLEQIILDANPEAKEKLQYENRLRDYELFGYTREKLNLEIAAAGSEQEKELLLKKLEVFELLEKQHTDNMVKIRKDARSKAKAEANEIFEENFKARKNALTQELSNDEQDLNLLKGIGALTAEEAFNTEVALQQKRLSLIREEVEARRQAGLDITNILNTQHSEELALTDLYIKEFNRRSQMYIQYGETLGSALGNVISNQEDALKAFGDASIDILFDILSQIIQVELMKVMASSTSSIMRATAEAMSTPTSALTFGASGFATAAILTGAITAATVVAKTALKGMLGKGRNSSSSSSSSGSGSSGQITVKQQATGKYDVIGEQDGQLYKDVPYSGPAQTGMVYKPTLVGESGAELVVSSPDMKALQKHINYPIIVQAINDARTGRVPQRADGKYGALGSPDNIIQQDPVQSEMLDLLRYLKTNGIDAHTYFGDTEYQARLNRVNETNKRFTRS